MIKQSFKGWSDVRVGLTMSLYGIIKELLRLQFKFDLFHEDLLEVIADSLTDITQSDKLVLYGLSFLHFMPNLKMEQDSSPLDGVILKILRSRWDTNRLGPRVWANGHSQRMIMHAAGESLNPGESAQLTQLTTEVMSYYVNCSVHDHQEREMKASFLQTGSTWLRDLAINNMRNWSRISLLTTDIILNTTAFTQDNPITQGNCIHVLCLLSSDERTCSKIRDLGGMDEIMDFLPKQFPEKRGEVNPLHTSTLHNSNLRFTLRTLRHLTDPDDDDLHESRTNRNTNLKKVFDTLQAWMRDETSQGLTLQVLYNFIRDSDKTRDPAQQDFSTLPDAETDMDPYRNVTPEGLEEDRTILRAQDALYRLKIESHRIEQATRNLQDTPSQHHVTQGMGMRILQALTPRGFSLDMRTPEIRDLRWSHSISGTCFDSLPDLEEVTIILSYWHCLKAAWHSQTVTISVPSSGNITELSQMLLWNHPYAAIEPFRQGILAFDETRSLQDAIPLTTTIQALRRRALRTRLHLLLPDWEAGHSDMHPRRNHMTEHTAKQVLIESIQSITSAWNHDGGEALGNLGNKILGCYKLVTQPTSPSSLSRLWVKVIDHQTNRHTPWFRNTQVLPHRLRILGNPRTQAIDLQIPTQPGQTSLEAIHLTLQIMGCERENLQYESERTRVFKTSQILRVGPCQPEPTRSEHRGPLLLQPHSTFELTDRLTMFLPAR